MTYLDCPKIPGNYWERPVDVYHEAGLGGADEHPLTDIVIGSIWMAAALGFIVLVLLLPGIVAG